MPSKKFQIPTLLLLFLIPCYSFSQEFEHIDTEAGPFQFFQVGHASLIFKFQEKIIHIDPWSKLADYETFPKADLIVITHHHRDHLDNRAIEAITTKHTKLICTTICDTMLEFEGQKILLGNGDTIQFEDILIEAVPAYNLIHKRENGEYYHPKGDGNGYIFTVGNKRIYVAGDTEDIPEMKNIGFIDIAWLPMNLPYTMSPEMVANAAKMIRPTILYPYHYGETNTQLLLDLLSDEKEVEIRIK